MDTFTDTGALDSRLGAPAKAFVGRRNRLLIDGKLVDAASGKTFPDYNPATGTILAQVAEADAEDVDRAVKAARRAFDEGPWSKMSPSDRGKLLWKLAALIEQNSEEFAEIESIDNGKPVGVARMADVPLAVDMFRYMGAGPPRLPARPSRYPSQESFCPTPCGSRSASWGRSFPGTSHSSWRRGKWRLRWRSAARSY